MGGYGAFSHSVRTLHTIGTSNQVMHFRWGTAVSFPLSTVGCRSTG